MTKKLFTHFIILAWIRSQLFGGHRVGFDDPPRGQILRDELSRPLSIPMSGSVQSLASRAAPEFTFAQDRRRSGREMRRLDAWLSDSSGDGVLSQQQQITVTSLSM